MFILIGLIIIAVGVMMVIKTEALLNMFGRIEVFDKYLGTEGGSRLGYKIVAMIVIFIGILVMTNMIGDFIQWLFAPVLRFNQPRQ